MSDYLELPEPFASPDFAAAFDEVSFWSSQFGRLLSDHLPMTAGAVALDLACGTGFPLLELAAAFGPTSRWVGLDPWEEALGRARLKLRVDAIPNAFLVRGGGAGMPFADRSFDLIVSNLGVNNFEQLEDVLAECARVLRAHGRLALTTNPRGHMQEFYAVFRELIGRRGRPEEIARLEAEEAHRLDRAALVARLERVGFTIERVVEDRFVRRYLDGGALLRHPLTRAGFLPGWRSVIEPPEAPSVFARLEEQLNRVAAARGELRITVPMLYLEARR